MVVVSVVAGRLSLNPPRVPRSQRLRPPIPQWPDRPLRQPRLHPYRGRPRSEAHPAREGRDGPGLSRATASARPPPQAHRTRIRSENDSLAVTSTSGHAEDRAPGSQRTSAADLVFDPTLACCSADRPAVAARRLSAPHPGTSVRARFAPSPLRTEGRSVTGQDLLLSRTMLSNHGLPYVGRFACDWHRLATTDPQRSDPQSRRRRRRHDDASAALSPVRAGTGPGIDPLLGGQPQRHEVADQDQIEQLGQVAVALGPHLDHVGHDLARPAPRPARSGG